mmetsp:Transcript_14255/g.36938  ORF Transcript_14255/g.36938 Transcript_14255/m.36938 type:complete len:106 (-) Transcript_14255:370-687(-)
MVSAADAIGTRGTPTRWRPRKIPSLLCCLESSSVQRGRLRDSDIAEDGAPRGGAAEDAIEIGNMDAFELLEGPPTHRRHEVRAILVDPLADLTPPILRRDPLRVL